MRFVECIFEKKKKFFGYYINYMRIKSFYAKQSNSTCIRYNLVIKYKYIIIFKIKNILKKNL